MPCEFPPLVSERSAQSLQQLLGLLVGLSGGDEADVHAADRIDLVEVDLGEDDLLLQAEGVVAAAIEGVAVDAAEVANAGQRDIEEAVNELVHTLTTQGDLCAAASMSLWNI